MTAGILPGPYRVPAYRAIGHFRLTNKTPAATYRAPGRYETTFVRERLIDAIAAQARHRPHRGAPPQRHHRRGNALSRARSKRSARKSNTTPAIISACSTSCSPRSAGRSSTPMCRSAKRAGELVGIGVAMFVEKSGLGPTDGVQDLRRYVRRGRGRHRRRLARPGLRDRDGAGRRRRARRRLPSSAASSTARPTASPSASARMPRAPR